MFGKRERERDCAINMRTDLALDINGWACAQPFPTLAT